MVDTPIFQGDLFKKYVYDRFRGTNIDPNDISAYHLFNGSLPSEHLKQIALITKLAGSKFEKVIQDNPREPFLLFKNDGKWNITNSQWSGMARRSKYQDLGSALSQISPKTPTFSSM